MRAALQQRIGSAWTPRDLRIRASWPTADTEFEPMSTPTADIAGDPSGVTNHYAFLQINDSSIRAYGYDPPKV